MSQVFPQEKCKHTSIQRLIYEWLQQLFSLIVKKCQDPECPSPGEQTSKLWYTHTMEYDYWTIKMNELMTHITTWMNLKCIITWVKGATLRSLHTVWFCLYVNLEIAKLQGQKSELSVGGNGRLPECSGKLLRLMEIFCILIMMILPPVYMYQNSSNCMFKRVTV